MCYRVITLKLPQFSHENANLSRYEQSAAAKLHVGGMAVLHRTSVNGRWCKASPASIVSHGIWLSHQCGGIVMIHWPRATEAKE
jgi:hypothetical protein